MSIQTLVGIRERIGVLPQAEESEEVRLELVRLVKAVLEVLPSSAHDHIDHLASILEKSCYDKFPDVKKLACELIVCISRQQEVGVNAQKQTISLTAVLAHTHAAVVAIGSHDTG